ncbi:MAG: hypothetical protein ACRDWD_01325 [Acidimicrobiia bacterium]
MTLPVVRRVDEVVTGAPVQVGNRLVTPQARRTGWAVGGRNWVFFRLADRPLTVTVDDRESGRTTVVPVHRRQQHVLLAMLALALLFLAHIWRRST